MKICSYLKGLLFGENENIQASVSMFLKGWASQVQDIDKERL